jgi:hypothetical protein
MYRYLENFLKFWSNSGYWKSPKTLDLDPSIFNISFCLYIASKRKAGTIHVGLELDRFNTFQSSSPVYYFLELIGSG